MIATCNKCGEFKVPWDEIGKALMTEHLKVCAGTLLEDWRKVTIQTPTGK